MHKHIPALILCAVIAAACHINGEFTPSDPFPGSRYEFDFGCEPAGVNNDDALVFPGQPGAAHLHQYFGVTMTADMTRADLVALAPETTCHGQGNQSAYWVPAAFDGNGNEIAPIRATGYYRARGKQGNTYPIPDDLKMLTFDHVWDVNQDGDARVRLFFGDCLSDSDSADHVSHAVESTQGVCPSSHPYPAPRIELRVVYPVQPVTLSSGALDTAHADFYGGWDAAEMHELTNRCINEGRDAPGNLELCRSHRNPNT